MESRGIHHLGVAVPDLDEAVATYERLFGLQVAFVHPDAVHGVLSEVVSVG
jgi:catechol 2,3-dioxygenase-like lactoylglutathione lyase family enzyme